MLGVRELLSSGISIVAALLLLAGVVSLYCLWHSYFKANQSINLNIANLLSAISLGITGVSILLPTTGAILLFYLGQISSETISTSYPLLLAIFLFVFSLLFGLISAFSFSTQYPDGVKAEWTSDYKWHAVFFGAQFVWFFVGLLLVGWFFLTVPLSVRDLLQKPEATTESATASAAVEKKEATTMNFMDEFDTVIRGALIPGEKLKDIKVAAQIIVEERLTFSGRKQATLEDAEVALLSLCIPIPGGPPKNSNYREKVREFRRENVPGSGDDKEKQEKIRESLQEDLLRVSRKEFYYPPFEKFFHTGLKYGTAGMSSP